MPVRTVIGGARAGSECRFDVSSRRGCVNHRLCPCFACSASGNAQTWASAGMASVFRAPRRRRSRTWSTWTASELWACGAAPGRGRYGADRRGERRVGGERLRPDGARRVPRGSGRRVGPGDAGAWDPTARSSPGTVTPAAYHPPRGQLPISPVLAGWRWTLTACGTANFQAHGDGPGRVGGLPCGARESSSALPVRSATAEVCRVPPRGESPLRPRPACPRARSKGRGAESWAPDRGAGRGGSGGSSPYGGR